MREPGILDERLVAGMAEPWDPGWRPGGGMPIPGRLVMS
jgi:hypothetical protein